MLKKDQLQELIKQFQAGTISESDLALLKAYLKHESSDNLLMEIIEEIGSSCDKIDLDAAQSEKLFDNIFMIRLFGPQHRKLTRENRGIGYFV